MRLNWRGLRDWVLRKESVRRKCMPLQAPLRRGRVGFLLRPRNRFQESASAFRPGAPRAVICFSKASDRFEQVCLHIISA